MRDHSNDPGSKDLTLWIKGKTMLKNNQFVLLTVVHSFLLSSHLASNCSPCIPQAKSVCSDWSLNISLLLPFCLSDPQLCNPPLLPSQHYSEGRSRQVNYHDYPEGWFWQANCEAPFSLFWLTPPLPMSRPWVILPIPYLLWPTCFKAALKFRGVNVSVGHFQKVAGHNLTSSDVLRSFLFHSLWSPFQPLEQFIIYWPYIEYDWITRQLSHWW